MSIDAGFSPLTEKQVKVIKSLRQRKYRYQQGAFLAEGVRLCEEALSAESSIRQAIFSEATVQHERVQPLIHACLSRGIPVSSASEQKFKAFSDEKNPQGIAFIVDIPAPAVEWRHSPLVIAADGLQDPGNLGTLLRTADWFNVGDAILGNGCVDAFNPKVVRATMGAIFRMTIRQDIDLADECDHLAAEGYHLYAADINSRCSLAEVLPSGRDVIIIGSEAGGLSQDVARRVHRTFTIPRLGHGESLNAAVAAAICLYHFTQPGTLPRAAGQ